MMLEWIALASLLLAALPAGLGLLNLFFFRAPRPSDGEGPWPVSVLIPARDEAARIGKTLDAVLANPNPALEVVVMDDHSEDATADLVRERIAADPRVRLELAPPLASGWNGKQHACYALSQVATHDVLVFLDADVHLEPDALRRIRGALEASVAPLVSGFPRQITKTFLERLLIPLVHFVLLGFLPIVAMRRSRSPSFGAGCGQLMVARRGPYADAGGHAALRGSRHDGVKLPRAFRRAGHPTDLFDATPLASVRMYENAREVWQGLVKNADEGMATPRAIVPWSVLLLGGQVLPHALLLYALLSGASSTLTLLAGVAVGLGMGTRLILALRFGQPLDSVLLHPLGVLALMTIQFEALIRRRLGRPVAWRGRDTS